MSNWVTRKSIMQDITFPALIWGQEGFWVYNKPKYFLYRNPKAFINDNFSGGKLIDVEGIQYDILDSKLGNIKLNSLVDIFNILLPWASPREIIVDINQPTKIAFEVFKSESIRHAKKNKWYRFPNQGLSAVEQYKSIIDAESTQHFKDLFLILGNMQSMKYQRNVY